MDTLRAIALMTLAMLGLAIADVFVKLLAETMPAAHVLVLSGAGAAIVFALWAMARRQRPVTREIFGRAVMLRNAFDMFGTVCLVTALARSPLSTVSAIFQAMPLIVTLGAAVFLGAPVGWRRWLAIAVGLVGVLIIIRPGSEGFNADALWSVGAAVALAGRDLATRLVPRTVSSQQIATWAMLAVTLAGLILMPFTEGGITWSVPVALYLAGAVAAVVGGIYCITAAMRIGNIAAVAPFRYTRIVFALILAMLVFGERPDLWTYVGAAIVVASGLYAFWRERKAL